MTSEIVFDCDHVTYVTQEWAVIRVRRTWPRAVSNKPIQITSSVAEVSGSSCSRDPQGTSVFRYGCVRLRVLLGR